MLYAVDIFFIVLTLMFAIVGYVRGFIKSTVPLVSIVVAILVSSFLTGWLASFINDKVIMPAVTGVVEESISEELGLNDEFSDVNKFLKDNLERLEGFFERWDTDGEKLMEELEDRPADEKEKTPIVVLAETVAAPISNVISRVIAFALLFILSYIAVVLILGLVNVVFNIPLLKTVNKVCGLLLGLISALFFIWLITVISGNFLPELIKIFPDLDTSVLESSVIYKWFRDNNIWAIVKHSLL
ncbi:MAG: CvpA family protein [Ruminococcaceae bacterium]|nr:CvpA family protein [Oscillospiraceae bacterium]